MPKSSSSRKTKKAKTAPRKAKTASRVESPNLVLLALCDAVSRDPNTGKATLYGIFDIVQIRDIGQQVPAFSVFIVLRSGKGSQVLKFELVDPTGKSIVVIETGPLDFSENARVHCAVQFAGIKFTMPGTHKLVVRAGRKRIGEPYLLNVKIKDQKNVDASTN